MTDENPPRRYVDRSIARRLDEILDEIRRLHGAFPRTSEGETDLEGHRKYHEALIEAAHAQEQFWRELRLEVAKKGIWGILVILVGLILSGALAKLGFAVPTIVK